MSVGNIKLIIFLQNIIDWQRDAVIWFARREIAAFTTVGALKLVQTSIQTSVD